MKSLILVGANKGGVGKTTIARLLLDYLAARLNGFRVFDGQAPGGSLKRFYPEAEVIDFHGTAGRMRVLDGLSDRPTLVDIPAGLLSETLQLLRDAGILEDAAKGAVHLSVVHVVAPSFDSLLELSEIAGRLADGGDHNVIKNCVNDEKFEWAAGTFPEALARIAPKGLAEVPHLTAMAREAADAAGGTFTNFVVDNSRSDLLRRLTMKWQGDVFRSFDGAGFRALAAG